MVDVVRPGRWSNPRLRFALVLVAVVIVVAVVVIVVLAATGGSDKKAVSGPIDQAEKSYCASHHTFATMAELTSAGLLGAQPAASGVVVVTPNSCASGAYIAGSTTFTPTSGPRVLAASNNTPGFSFLAQSFAAQRSSIQFLFGASGNLAKIATGTTVSGAGQPGNQDVLFASADQANVNKVIAPSQAVASGAGGKCDAGADCSGIGSTKAEYAVGQLVVYSCKSGGVTLPPAEASHSGCQQPVGGFLTAPPKTAADIISLLNQNPADKLAIANPGDDDTLPPKANSVPTAPYGLAAYQALTAPAAHGGGGLTDTQYKALEKSGRIVYGANVGATQTIVQTGAAQIALLPESFERSPSSQDTNNWTEIQAKLHDPITQWAVVLNHGSSAQRNLAQQFLDYVRSAPGQAVLRQFGYTPISA